MYQIYDSSSGWSQSLGFGSVEKIDSVVLENNHPRTSPSLDTLAQGPRALEALGQSIYDAYSTSSNQVANTMLHVALDIKQLEEYILSNGGSFRIAVGGEEDDDRENDIYEEGIAQRTERDHLGDPKDPNLAVKREDATDADIARQTAFNEYYSDLKKLDPNNVLLERLSDPDTIPSLNETKKLKEAVFNLSVRAKTCPTDPEPVLPPGAPAPGTILEKGQRLELYYESMKHARPVYSAQEGLQLVSKSMDMIEDAYSGVKAKESPGLSYNGRMYPPRPDNITQNPDGSMTAKTKGNQIEISARGDIRIFDYTQNRTLGPIVFTKAGGQ